MGGDIAKQLPQVFEVQKKIFVQVRMLVPRVGVGFFVGYKDTRVFSSSVAARNFFLCV